MHVLFVSQYFPPEIGATQTRMHEFARALAARGHRVTVLTEFPNHPQGIIPPSYRGRLVATEAMDGFTVERVWVRTSPVKTFASRLLFYLSFLAMATLRGAVLNGPIDVVVATSPPLPVGLAGWLIARRHGARFVLDVRDLWPAAAEALGELRDPLLIRIAGILERFLYAQADRITTVTRGFVAAITRTVRGRRPVVFVPNGAATELFDPAFAKPGLRETLGFDGRFVVTFAGLLGLAQGLGVILDAAALVADEPIVFCLLGDGPLKPELVRAAEGRGLRNVRFLPAVPTSEVTPYLLASDALLVVLRPAPIFDIFVPSKLFDFLACARPVILMVGGEAREILAESGGGVWVAPDDAAGLAGAARALAAMSPADRDAMGQRGRAYVLAHFTRAVQNERMAGLLEELVAPA